MASIVSVNVASPEEVTFAGRTFTTAIRKRALTGPARVCGVNVDGDDQADRSVHGGPSKALYAYASEDYAYWRAEGRAFSFGTLGENLTTAGVDIGALRIGEHWRAGNALLEVSEPRIPCFKLGYAAADARFPKVFGGALRFGSYFRIVEEGIVAAGDAFERVWVPDDHDVTIAEVSRIRMVAPHERAKLADVGALSLGWRGWAMELADQSGR